MIDVVEEGVERPRALADAAIEHAPFGGGEDARQQVERDQPLRVAALAIDREGDADAAEDRLRFLQSRVEALDADFLDPAAHLGIARPHRAGLIGHLEKGHPLSFAKA